MILAACERETELREDKENMLNQIQEHFEMLALEKRFSAELNIQPCETKKTLQSFQTDRSMMLDQRHNVKI